MLKLSALFGRHAVLQSGISIPVWGWTEPQTMIECTLAGEKARVMASTDGKFLLRLKVMPAGGPHELNVRNLNSGETVTVGDIMIGEVWLASGQSNMEMNLGATGDNESIQNAGVPEIRMITVPHATRIGGVDNFKGEWVPATPETAKTFSAAAFHFARRLHADLGVSVGIIHSSWGGSIAEAWNSRESLMTNPAMVSLVQSYESRLFKDEIWENVDTGDLHDPEFMVIQHLVKALGLETPENLGVKNGWAEQDFNDSSWRTMELPQSWRSAGEDYNGVIWFRRTVDIPAEPAGKEWRLDLGAIDKQDITYVNGVEVGATGKKFETACWNWPREYTIPAGTLKPGRNVIAVRAYSFLYDGGMIGPAANMRIFPAEDAAKAMPLAGEWRFEAELNMGNVTASPVLLPLGPGVKDSPYMLFENKIRPLLPYALRGVIWYQGESNAGRWPTYRGLMESMIHDWRRAWGQGSFPFYQVQLANFRPPMPYQENSQWAYIREAQNKSGALGGGAAVTIDCGEAADIHPKDKKTVGERLAALALHHTYRKHDVIPCGPVYQRMTIEGNAIRLYFKRCDGGLSGTGGFFIADASGAFKPARVTVEGDTVLVSNPEILFPVMVRYAWADNPEGANLRNGAGFPASPFRTDG
jgi:sialate O-acetylesterase